MPPGAQNARNDVGEYRLHFYTYLQDLLSTDLQDFGAVGLQR